MDNFIGSDISFSVPYVFPERTVAAVGNISHRLTGVRHCRL